jgi:hypothetical protein
MFDQPVKRLFHGDFVHSLSNRQLEYLKDTLLAVDEHGIIAFTQPGIARTDVDATVAALQQPEWSQASLIKLQKGEFLIPGYIWDATSRIHFLY